MITQTFDLNMIPDSSPVVVHINQYDIGAGRLVAKLYKGETPYTPATGATAQIQGTKPDGRGFEYSATLSGSTVTANVTDQMSIVAGPVRCQIVVQEGDNITGTFAFIIDVQKSALPADTDMSASEYQIVKELLDDVIGASTNPPYIGENGNWWVWSVEQDQYVDSGIDASITVRIADVSMLEPNAAPYVTNSGTNTDPIFHLYIPRGYTGNGIASITKTGSVGLVDTYTISYTNGTTTTFEVTNGASGVGGGSTVVVTVNDSSFYGKSVSITDGNTTETTTFDNSGRATFTGLSMTGNLTISSNNGSSTATTTLSAPYFGNYTVELALWSATIDISVSSSALNGLTVYAKKNGVTYGSTTIVSGAASIDVSEAGTYSIECTLDWNTYSTNVVVSAETTYTATLTTFAATVNLTTPNSEFYGESIAVTVDGTPITGTAFSGSGTATFTALRTGTYVFSITYSGQSYTATVTVSAESTYSAQIKMWNATISISTTSASLYGNVIYVKKSGTTVGSATFDNTGSASVMVHETGTYTVETTYGGWTYSAEVVVSAETTYSATLNTFNATLSISTTSPDLYGQTITIKKGSTTIGTTTFSSSGSASYTVHETGTYTCEVTVSGQTYTGSATVSAQTTYNVAINIGVVYGFHIEGSESDPSAKITYLEDAVGMTPAHMDYTTGQFDYGSWGDAFFMPKPCMLKSDGTVDYYLDPDDLTKKEDGVTASDIANTSYNGNAMVEWGQNGKKIWMKIVPSNDHLGADIYISDYQEDADYHDWPFHDSNGQSINHFYTPIYNGSVINSKMRSLSGQTVSKSLTAAQEITAAQLNNPSSDIMWNTELFSDIDLINKLLFLMAKSTDTQTVYGEGLHTGGSEAVNNGFTTGVHNSKGMFYGTNSGTVSSGSYGNTVKVFFMENWWGFQWRRYQGHVLDNGVQKVKCTYGTEDGSTANGYTVNGEPTGAGYKNTGATALSDASGNYIKYMYFTADGMVPCGALDGSSSTYYCDACWYDNSAVRVAQRGGDSSIGAKVGASSVNLARAASRTNWDLGAALSCKPLAA